MLVVLIFVLLVLLPYQNAYSRSVPHHVYNISRRLVATAGAPFYGILVDGPRNIKKVWHEEVWGQEKPENRGKLKYRVAAIWRAPGEEMKGIIDGITYSVSNFGAALKELVSIFFGD
ncbi:MAG: hypothetical protein NC916_00855 [Candidatus Omnitrophica bacterium]|nr:hypothetical protein [Candidatus Omnitrophota bacterium]